MDYHSPQEVPVPFAPIVGAGGLGLTLLGQFTATNATGIAGIIMSLTALLGGGFQYFKAILDAKQRDKQIENQALQIAKQNTRIGNLENDLAGSRHRRHEDANRFNHILMEYSVKIASLETRLGITDKTHVEAININSDDIDFLADRMGTRLPKKPPHLEETAEEPEFDKDGNRLVHEPPSDL